MRVIDVLGNDIVKYDLDNGYLVDTRVIKKDADPVDDITKFAYAEDDYEDAKMYIHVPLEEKISSVKAKLNETDYVAIKIAEGVATAEEYADVIKQRKEWRKEINELEMQLRIERIK